MFLAAVVAESSLDLYDLTEDHILRLSPLPAVPLAVAGSLVAGLMAWQYSDRLAGLLVCWAFAVRFLFC